MMPSLMTALIAALAMLPLQAAAQTGGSTESIVDACHGNTPIGSVEPDCIGGASRECQKQPGGNSSLVMTDCIIEERDLRDRVLNREYTEARKALAGDKPTDDSLLAAQPAWITWRDAECALEHARYGGGPLPSMASASCQMWMTARRAIEMKAYSVW